MPYPCSGSFKKWKSWHPTRRTTQNNGGIESLFRKGFVSLKVQSIFVQAVPLLTNMKYHSYLVYYCKRPLRSTTTIYESTEYQLQLTIFWSSMTTTNSLYVYCTRQCPQSEVHLIYPVFQHLALLLSLHNCHHTDRFVMSDSRILCIWSTPQKTNYVQHRNHYTLYSLLFMHGLMGLRIIYARLFSC